MKASLRSVLIGCVSIILMAVFPVRSVSANGMLRTSISGAGATTTTGGTRFAIHIDARAALIIREWRIAHGLEKAGSNAQVAAVAMSPQGRTQSMLEQQCHNDGGSVSTYPVARGDAAAANRQEAVCV
ncbi:MAG: hypothetical protein EPN49_08420 [Rhodanobacter sp.]|nr:MAG: hypothetical protein EPN49_08420 [Rhodanobacter sp.]